MDQQNRGGLDAASSQQDQIHPPSSGSAAATPNIILPSTDIGPGFEGQVPAVSSRPTTVPPQPQTQSPFAVHREAPMPVPLKTSNQIDQGHYQSQAATHIESMNSYSSMQPTTSPPEGLGASQQSGFLQENYAQQSDTHQPATPPVANPHGTPTRPQAVQSDHSQPHIKQKKKKGNRKLIYALVAGLGSLLLIGLIGALLYFFWYLPNRPNNVVARSIVNSALSETSHGRLIVDYSVKGSDSDVGGDFSVDGGLSIQANLSDAQNAASGSLSVRKTTIRFNLPDISDDAIEITIAEIPVILSGVATEDRYYVKVDGSENMLSGAEDIIDFVLDQFKNEVSASELSDLRTDIQEIIDTAITDLEQINNRWFSDMFDGVEYLEELRSESNSEFTACIQDSGQLNSVTKEAISSYLNYPVLEVRTDHGTKTVRENIEARHFTVEFNEANYSAFAASIAKKARTSPEIVKCLENSDYADILEDPQFTGDQEIKLDPDDELPDLIFDIWIDNDKTIRQVVFSFDQNDVNAEFSLGFDILESESVTTPNPYESVDILEQELADISERFNQSMADLEKKYQEQAGESDGLSAFGDSSGDIAALEDIENIKEQLITFGEEGATVPLNEEQLTGALTDEFKETLTGEYVIRFTSSNVINEANEIHYSNRAYCDGNFVATTLEPQSFALLARLPSGSYSCTDNDKGPNQPTDPSDDQPAEQQS